MAAAYTKEFLVEIALSHWKPLGQKVIDEFRPMYEVHFDEVGKEKFRVHCSLDAAAIRKWKETGTY